MSAQIADGMPSQLADSSARPPSKVRPIVIGLYGVPGSGKSFLLNQLKQQLGEEHFAFYEGSDMLASLVPGGLEAFHKLSPPDKEQFRNLAIDTIRKECAEGGRVGVVAGHFMFWDEGDAAGEPVHTSNDLNTYTHMLYLDLPAELISQRRLGDTQRTRPGVSIDHLRKWQRAEAAQLRRLCREHGILFSLLPTTTSHPDTASALLRDFRVHTEERNLARAEGRLDEILAAWGGRDRVETVLVLDADRTLVAEDTGTLFWQNLAGGEPSSGGACPLKELFGSPLGYSYAAFQQAALLYGDAAAADRQLFDAACDAAASAVAVHPDFAALLRLVAGQEHVAAVVVSCGLRRVWEAVLAREGLRQTVKVIGGGHIADGGDGGGGGGLIVTAEVKAALVARLQEVHGMHVWAFGDSVLDLPMLAKADEAIVVVGEEHTRSKTMDAALLHAIDHDGLRARQVLLPWNAPPRLDATKLPILKLADFDFVGSVLRRHRAPDLTPRILHATGRSAAKLLMTPMRDARVAGPALREAHRRVGWYLATEFLADVAGGVEEHPIPHVQGGTTSGHRLLRERQTSVVALMRGGEAMAFGVNDAFPLATFVHAREAEDLGPHHLSGRGAVLLVDSVVNSGKTVVEFVQRVRSLHAAVRIVVVAGVVQAQSVSEGRLAELLACDENLSLVTLRLSDNKFTGRGTTDTGNRLFNTTHLD
ncbi:uracil phosphoribosyltransferase-domain-containing protein [Phialemonium atrogriseum]|uniref:Uracil phosphoribosyltransferase-domain-containing protein n=1 Tax=Phialemonium atrogriseum TaxID=1093897 RepID=A0AAJ0CCX4_9PEZI|nr:uracil phosphoribosyltransferase-domain-containing protein [Phialemonium atrogriseum]KAK1772026.1 uracil phosphoribosyltransferase-domain-containing protein [Phialemonium atrogriseum]